MRDALSIFDRVVSFSGNNLTREAVTENLNVLDYDVYFSITDLILENKIPEILVAFNTVLSKGFEGHHFINGLASHFRDLLVSKDKATVELLEVGDTAKKKYLEQSTKANIPFLIEAINKANDCDLNYRTSKNQRLLVELTLMQIASINFDGEKKKSANYIIPATFFTSLSPAAKSTVKIVENKKEVIKVKETTPALKIAAQVPKPVLKNVTRRTSSLSLKSVHLKKEENKEETLKENYDNHPKDTFTQKELEKAWKLYHSKLLKSGQKSIAATLNADLPVLKADFKISLTLPNTLMQDQIEKEKPKLIKHLRTALNNYGIQLTITVNEMVEKKFAYTPQEKYNKLLEKNPNLALLKDIFKLDF